MQETILSATAKQGTHPKHRQLTPAYLPSAQGPHLGVVAWRSPLLSCLAQPAC